jgi:acyl carrier protein
MPEDIQNKLLEFIIRSFMVEREEIDLDKSMIDEGIIDSFGLIEIATFLENEFHITISEEKMIRTNFGSVHKIVNFVKREQEK